VPCASPSRGDHADRDSVGVISCLRDSTSTTVDPLLSDHDRRYVLRSVPEWQRDRTRGVGLGAAHHRQRLREIDRRLEDQARENPPTDVWEGVDRIERELTALRRSFCAEAATRG
jgi:hypothetical protein